MLDGEICARRHVQESVKKAMQRVVSEDCSLVRYDAMIFCVLFLQEQIKDIIIFRLPTPLR